MNIYDFVNSKTLFKVMRYAPETRNHVPVMVHVNYHPVRRFMATALLSAY
jgi:hypothetical protein